jgi:hypothetical protein
MTEQIINIELRYLAESQPSLCIPRVFNNISESKIRQVFDELGLGRISGVDIKERRNEKGDSFKRVYIHFEKWFWNENAQSARKKLVSGKEIKIVYDNPWFWKVSASKWTPSRDYEIGETTTQKSARIIDDYHYQVIDDFDRELNDYKQTRKEYDNNYKRISAAKERFYNGERNYDFKERNYDRDRNYDKERSYDRDRNYDKERSYDSRERNYDSKERSYDRERSYDIKEHKDYKNIVPKKVVNTNIPSLPYVSSSSSTAPLKLKKKNDLSKKVKSSKKIEPTKKKEKVLLVEEVVEVVEEVKVKEEKLEKELLKEELKGEELEEGELEEGELEEEEITLPPLELSQEQKEILEDLYGDFKKLNL